MRTASLGGGKNAIGAAEALSAFKCWTIEVKKVSITYSFSLLPTVSIFFWRGQPESSFVLSLLGSHIHALKESFIKRRSPGG